MITLETIIRSINTLINNDNGVLVLYKEARQHPKFRIYKTVIYKLFLVKDTKNKTKVFTYEHVKKFSELNIEEAITECDMFFLPELLKWLTTNDFKKLCNGV